MSNQKPARTSFNLSVFLNGASTAINVVLLLVEGMIAGRFVTESNNGIFSILISLIYFFMVFSDLGFKSGITQRIASAPDERKEDLANSTITFRLLVTSIVAIFLWFSKDLIAAFQGFENIDAYMGYVIFMFFATSMDELMISLLRGFQTHKPLATLQIVKAVTRLSTTAILVLFFDLQLLALIISWSFGLGLAAFIAYFSLPIKKRFFINLKEIIEVIKFCRPLIVIRIVAFFRTYASNFLLVGLLTPEAVAFYAFAQKIPNGLQSLTESYNSVFYPRITELRANGDLEGANNLLNNSLRILSFLLGGVALFGFVFGNEIMTLLFSETYSRIGYLFGLILVGLQIQVVNSFIGFALTGAGSPKESSIVISASTPFMLGINYALILSLANGVLGPALGIIIEGTILNAVFKKVAQIHQYSIQSIQYIKSTILMAIGIGASFFIEQMLNITDTTLMSWSLNIFLVLGYAGIAYLWKIITIEDINFLTNLRKK
ncbi:MAG: lipopolysaccharide biosynthesis protein [Anaerolineae bacterium]